MNDGSNAFWKSLCCVAMFCCAMNLTAVAQKSGGSRPLKLFIIGNSSSQNATRYLKDIVREKGDSIIIGRAEMGGCTLQRHWDSAAKAAAGPSGKRGRAYAGKTLRTLLGEQEWDVVTMQQYSGLSGDSTSYQPWFDSLYQLVKSIRPNAKVVLHQTWAYREDAKGFSKIAEGRKAQSALEMYQASRAAYHKVATDYGLRVIPVGDAFWKVVTSSQWRLKAQKDFDKASQAYPAITVVDTNSLHVGWKWTADKQLAFDANHASNAGCYLGSLVWYGFFFNAPVNNIRFKPADVDPPFAKALQGFAESGRAKSSDKKVVAGRIRSQKIKAAD